MGSTFSPGLLCSTGENTLQTTYTLPAGVITSWQHKGSDLSPGNGALLVARHVSGTTYLMVWVTSAVAFSPGDNKFPTQIPVLSGDIIGLRSVTGIGSCRGIPPDPTAPTADQPAGSGTPPMWQNSDFPNMGAGPLNVAAVVEPDVDVDGFGDETQDSCVGTFGTNRGCPVSSGGGGAGGGGGGGATTAPSGPFLDQVAPSILSMAFVPDRFRVNSAGVARKAPRGTSLRVTLSESGLLVVFVERKAKGRRVGGRCLANTRIRRIAPLCTRYVLAGAFSRFLVNKQSATSFAGRVLRNGVARNLAPGTYRATGYAVDIANNRSKGRRATFTIVSS